jgi:DNA-binding MarR family transcriptional regulator
VQRVHTAAITCHNSRLPVNWGVEPNIIDTSTGRSGVRRLAVSVWLRLAHSFQKISHASAEHLRCYGLSMAQFDVLAHVGAAEGITQQELADSLLVTKGNVCQLLDRMERSQLIERRHEGRANRLFLTNAGRQLFREVVPAHEALIARQFEALTPAEQRQLLVLLRKLDRSLGYRAACDNSQ